MQRQNNPMFSLFNIQNKILRIKRDSVLAIKTEERKNSEITMAAALDVLTFSLFPEPLSHLWALVALGIQCVMLFFPHGSA